MPENTPFHGIYPILYSYFGPDGKLLPSAFRLQIDACLAHGAHGVAILGLATEVGKLDLIERRQVLEWVSTALAGRLPLAVTVAEPSVSGQIDFVRAAKAQGASWVILQPPPTAGLPESEYLEFFSAVADGIDLPFALQNAPGLMASSLSNSALRELCRRHAHFRLLKGEGPASYVRQLIEETQGRLDVFNGYGGLQLPNSLRAGCKGLIPAIDLFDSQVQIYQLMRTGDAADMARAEAIYRDLLPLMVFMMTSVENLVAYGKLLGARRLGLGEVHFRAPGVKPTAFGIACMERYAQSLPPFLRTSG